MLCLLQSARAVLFGCAAVGAVIWTLEPLYDTTVNIDAFGRPLGVRGVSANANLTDTGFAFHCFRCDQSFSRVVTTSWAGGGDE